MCFGKSDSDEEGERVSARGNTHHSKLKRRRSPAEADHAEPQDPRKLSKLDSTASTLANNHSMPSGKLTGLCDAQKPSSPPPTDVVDDSPRIDKLQSPDAPTNRTSSSTERTLPSPSISHDTSLELRTAFIESYHASEELYSYTFQVFVNLALYPALRFQLVRSTKMRNDELAVCFDLISKTSQQDYKASSRGWHPTYKMEEMQDKGMMYLLIRQAEGYVGADKASEHESSAKHAGAILGFLSFKLEVEDEELCQMRPVLYIYEIHLDDRCRGQGLGGRIMQWVESQARLVKITKVMLTVFTVNEGARRMYEREGFVKDDASPEDRTTRRKVIKADYIIMSKELD